jgi:hypothetical protein
VPAAEFGPAPANSSALKTPRFPCRCWGFGVFGQALVRKTLSFSKKLENRIGAIWYFIHHYNATVSAASG